MTASQALGHCGDDDVTGSGRTMVLRARGWCGSMASQALERRGVHIIAG
jgi:hypothetical protein